MGWWKVQGTENLIGDAPLDTMTNAVAEVLSQYNESLGRKPTAAEWEALLHAVLGVEGGEEPVLSKGRVVGVRLEVE